MNKSNFLIKEYKPVKSIICNTNNYEAFYASSDGIRELTAPEI